MPALDPPVPTSATWNIPFSQLAITFSHPIRFHTPNDVLNWFIRISGRRRLGLIIAVGPAIVIIDSTGSVPDAGPDVVSYSPPPFDVVSDTVRPTPAPAFADFPVT